MIRALGARGGPRLLLLAMSGLVGGSQPTAPTPSEQADPPVIVVAASYPGANAKVVADVIAAPIEEQINGVKGMVRIESESGNDGRYVAHVYFAPKTDPKAAAELVRARVALAGPSLPHDAQMVEVPAKADNAKADKAKADNAKADKAKADKANAAIAVIDRRGHGWNALQKAAGAVMKRLATENIIARPRAFPQDEKQVFIEIDREKCASLRVAVIDVYKAIQKTDPAAKPDQVEKVIVRGKVSLGDVAAVKEIMGPAAVYRVDLHPAIRISGAPPDGESVNAAAAKCVDLAEAELKRLGFAGFSVQNLSAK
jgi:multidrug efflux pump subunit AcrB